MIIIYEKRGKEWGNMTKCYHHLLSIRHVHSKDNIYAWFQFNRTEMTTYKLTSLNNRWWWGPSQLQKLSNRKQLFKNKHYLKCHLNQGTLEIKPLFGHRSYWSTFIHIQISGRVGIPYGLVGIEYLVWVTGEMLTWA